jgi:hypothetical protein
MGGPRLIAGDDEIYLALRANGAGSVMRPVSPESVHERARVMAGADPRHPPMLVVRPSRHGDDSTWRTALALVALHPRLAVTEWDPASPASSPGSTDALTTRLAAGSSGTVFDWQTARLADQNAFASESGRATAAARLGALVAAIVAPVERLAYALEVEALTGVRMSEQTPSPAAHPLEPETGGHARSRALGERG